MAVIDVVLDAWHSLILARSVGPTSSATVSEVHLPVLPRERHRSISLEVLPDLEYGELRWRAMGLLRTRAVFEGCDLHHASNARRDQARILVSFSAIRLFINQLE